MARYAVKVLLLLFLISLLPEAQMLPNPYGPPVSVEAAKKAATAALAEAVKNHWNMAVAVVDPNGTLIYYEKMDNTQMAAHRFPSTKRARPRSTSAQPRRCRMRWLPEEQDCA